MNLFLCALLPCLRKQFQTFTYTLHPFPSPEISASWSVSFAFSSFSCSLLLQQSPLCCWPSLHQQEYHKSWSLPEQHFQCHAISEAKNLIDFFIENRLFLVSRALSSVPFFGSLVMLNPVFYFILALVTCSFSTSFGTQLTSTLLQTVVIVCPKSEQQLFFFAPLLLNFLPFCSVLEAETASGELTELLMHRDSVELLV